MFSQSSQPTWIEESEEQKKARLQQSMAEREKSSKFYKEDVNSNVEVMKKAEQDMKLKAAEKEVA